MNLDQLHDAKLVELEWSGDRMKLGFILDDGLPIKLELSGIRALRVEELREGNIVDEALLFDRDNCAPRRIGLQEAVEYLVAGGSLSTTAPTFDAYNIQITKILDSIASGDCQCFYLTPSYGCTLICLHKSLVTL